MLSGAASVYINSPVYDAEGTLIADKIKVGAINPGTGFGELALLNSKPRAATIMCDVECQFAVFEKDDYLRILKKFDERRLNALIDYFKALPLFANWTRQSVVKLTFYFKEQELCRNSYVFREGDPADSVYFIRKGDFYLLKSLHSGERPKKHKKEHVYVAILGSGEMFGNDEVMSSIARQNDCKCASSSGTVLRIERADFLRKIAFSSNLPRLTQQSVLRQEAHSKRIQEIEEVKQRMFQSHAKPRGEYIDPVKPTKKRSLSKVDASPSTSFELQSLSFSPDSMLARKTNKTMTNLRKLPDIAFRLKQRKNTLSPTRMLKKSLVKNIHMKALRDKNMSYYESKPYMAFVKKKQEDNTSEDDSLLAVSSFDHS
mmetsp:Transcript_1688/g.3612  ORF Transcript_1688/g.3612 Transcript_1688/m.3612 type:complete len:373 (+) Transcript_1688:81-1199(+)